METAVRDISAEKPQAPRRWLRRGTAWVLLLIALLWAGDAAVSFLLQHSRLREKLTAHLEAAFGRPVEVGRYGFSIWGGPVLEADSVRVGEDPRFGNEYFMRADSISVGLRWLPLLRGHLALGTLYLDHPSLNLVRAAGGDWNVARWLPRPAAAPGAAAQNPSGGVAPLRFRQIEISDGRIDFKRGAEKLAFAFVDVNGAVETDAPGRWYIELTASPWRAAVLTQRPGIIEVTGHVGGTSSRLRPAALDISWRDASIADFFRLLRGDDLGVRGNLEVSIRAHTEPRQPVNGWVLSGTAKLSGLHRWDLAARADNPSVSIMARQVLVDPSLSELRVVDARIDGPHTSASATAELNWTGSSTPAKPAIASSDFVDVKSSQVSLGDILEWVRAFRPGVADATSVDGTVHAQAHFSGWPPDLVRASVHGEGADITAAGLRQPEHVGPIDLHYDRGRISLRPVTLSWGTAAHHDAAAFRIEASPNRQVAMFPTWHVVGDAEDVSGMVATAAAFGLNLSHGWDLRGPITCDLRWSGALYPWQAAPVGALDLGSTDEKRSSASLRTPFLNLPVEQIHAQMKFGPGTERIALESAKAFGATWSGTFERRSADAEWHFALTGDRLSAADLDRWLDPRWRESFLDRMLPFLGPPASAVLPEDLLASGSMDLGEFTLKPFLVRHLQGKLKIEGRHLEFSDAQGQFYGGNISGLLRASLSATPQYHAEIAVSQFDGSELAATSRKLAGLRAESGNGHVSIDAKGSTRADLLASLVCRGTAQVTGLELSGLNVAKTLDAPWATAGSEQIPAGYAAFTCSRDTIDFQRLSLALGHGRAADGSGTVGFGRSLHLVLRDVSDADRARSGSAIRVTGQLSSPRVTRVPPPTRRR